MNINNPHTYIYNVHCTFWLNTRLPPAPQRNPDHGLDLVHCNPNDCLSIPRFETYLHQEYLALEYAFWWINWLLIGLTGCSNKQLIIRRNEWCSLSCNIINAAVDSLSRCWRQVWGSLMARVRASRASRSQRRRNPVSSFHGTTTYCYDRVYATYVLYYYATVLNNAARGFKPEVYGIND